MASLKFSSKFPHKFSSIGIISSCYKEKFGIPRRPNLVPFATAELILNKEFSEESIRELETFSHIWIQFVFHETQDKGWKPMVRPPRLGGDAKVGVFASRSTFRPNPLGLSVVKLLDVNIVKKRIVLSLSGCDLLDGTPVLDIKPYLLYVDSIPEAKSGFADNDPPILCEVIFTDKAELECMQAQTRFGDVIHKDKKEGGWMLKSFIKQLLELDPRPSYKITHESYGNKPSKVEIDRVYSMKLYDFDLKWQYTDNNKIKVIGLITEG